VKYVIVDEYQNTLELVLEDAAADVRAFVSAIRR
jgi:hypothetical protein